MEVGKPLCVCACARVCTFVCVCVCICVCVHWGRPFWQKHWGIGGDLTPVILFPFLSLSTVVSQGWFLVWARSLVLKSPGLCMHTSRQHPCLGLVWYVEGQLVKAGTGSPRGDLRTVCPVSPSGSFIL